MNDGPVTGDSSAAARTLRASTLLGLSLTALAGAMLLVPFVFDVDAGLWRAAALTVFALSNWATGLLPTGVTAISFFVLAMLFAVQPAGVVFAGFQSMALWLVFGGMVIGAAVQHTGLGTRLSRAILARFGRSYAAILGGIAVVSFVLSFLMPSAMGRVVLLMPIVLALADRLGFEKGSNGRHALVMTMILASFLPAGAILPSVVQSMVLAGLAETLYGLDITYGDYLLINLPVAGVLRCALIVLVIWKFLPDSPGAEPAPARAEQSGRMSRYERRLAVVIILALLLWFSDWWHGIAPGWIALAAGALILVPAFGLTKRGAFNSELDYNSLFYTAGILGLSAVITGTGLADVIGRGLFAVVPLEPGATVLNFASLTALSTVLGALVTNPGTPAVLSPFAEQITQLTGLPMKTVLMTQVIGFSNVIFPYQAAPVVVGMTLGGVGLGLGTRLTLLLTVLSVVVLWPLTYGWWVILGLF